MPDNRRKVSKKSTVLSLERDDSSPVKNLSEAENRSILAENWRKVLSLEKQEGAENRRKEIDFTIQAYSTKTFIRKK